ncbi:MAG: PilT/PilU family type 4a pilus ATPase [Deltaproteobacteria bacterium]|nr:PilT/PilU family type 4a pilus ATPase [Deltaproteobacteria bacterium]
MSKFKIEQLLEFMVKNNASDIYLAYDSPPRYRIEGITQPAGNYKLTMEDTVDLGNQMMDERQKKEFAETYECNLALFYPKLGRFRVNIFKQRNCVGAVIRLIRVKIMTTEELKLPESLNDVVMSKRGLVIVVGATGSGKSTSLAAMIDYRNRNSPGHIITIEDPVEFVHEHKKCIITQREVGTDTLSFRAALKNTLRQAPDVILLGEIRDAETMEHAVEFAETGHLSIGTLHANNANQAVERVMNFFPIEKHEQIYMQLSLNLRAIVSQRLVRTIDGKRRAAVEILLNKPRIADLIKKGEIDMLKEAMEQLTNEGLQTFDQALFGFYKEGIITYEEALVNSDSANNLRLKIKIAGLSIPGEENVSDDFEFKAAEPVPAQQPTGARQRARMKK